MERGARYRNCSGGRSRAAADVGITRIGASGTKRILANCRECGGLRWVVLERVPEEGVGG